MSDERSAVAEDSSSSISDILDTRDEDGWEDVEADEIAETFVSLFDDKVFSSIADMLTYCKDKYGFDLWQIQRQHDLDFLGLVKVVNYVRQQVKQGNPQPDVKSKQRFSDDVFLLPVLEDDAVLYSLEDVIQNPTTDEPLTTTVDELRDQLASLQSQFAAYREDVQKYLGGGDLQDIREETKVTVPEHSARHRQDNDYFKSYSYNAIHESMLKDTIRTDAYRDFIYDHKDVFRGKTVLDVGCGTGILSMFCAKAGAKLVIAVDNSDIVDKAQQNIKDNGLQDKITCVRGKIEEVRLPVDQVDVIVSEWMGYCLLYESMLDSVICARDKYLAPDGLMVPSHVTIQVAPLSDSELRISYIDFWKDVYGFNMTSMLEKAEEEVLTRIVDAAEVASEEGVTALPVDLHAVKVEDLDFTAGFSLAVKDGFDMLEGFVLWFDTYFVPSRTSRPASVLEAKANQVVAFSTGPASQPTHWQQGVCLIKDPVDKLKAGDVIQGSLTYKKQDDAHRALNIDIKWEVTGGGGGQQKSQTWSCA